MRFHAGCSGAGRFGKLGGLCDKFKRRPFTRTHGWDVRQFDGGGGSVVRVADPASQEVLTISLVLSQTESGGTVSCDEWLADAQIAVANSTRDLGGFTMDYREATIDEPQAQAIDGAIMIP